MWWIIGGIVVVIILYGIMTYNGFVSLINRCEEAFSTMDVYLQKRYDLIPNLVETVKGYATHEKETLEQVISARSKAMNASTVDAKLQAEGELSGVLSRLLAITESYPNLQANTNFLDLQAQLKTMESEIANSRKYYNGVIKTFNTKIQMFPSNLIAGMFNFTKKPMFEVQDETMRENVKVQF